MIHTLGALYSLKTATNSFQGKVLVFIRDWRATKEPTPICLLQTKAWQWYTGQAMDNAEALVNHCSDPDTRGTWWRPTGDTSTKMKGPYLLSTPDVYPWEYTCSPHRRGVPHTAVQISQPHRKASLDGVQHLWRKPSGGIPLQPSGDAAWHKSVICSQLGSDHWAWSCHLPSYYRCHWYHILSGTGMYGLCRLQSCSPITLSLAPPPGSGVLPNGRVPSTTAMRQMWIADLVCGQEWLTLQHCHMWEWGGKKSTICGGRTHPISTSADELERVEVFKYLCRLLAYNDNDARAVRGKLRKACGVWARLSRTIRSENASPHAWAVFYKAIVQSILLFGSKTWNLSAVSLKSLEGFHIWAAWCMAGKRQQKLLDGMWTYPNLVAILDKVGLKTIVTILACKGSI